MVKEAHFQLSSSSNRRFFAFRWMPGNQPVKGIVQIIPGMAEHARRYDHFARFLASHAYGVYCCDHPGQGMTAGSPENTGILPHHRGWQVMLENVRALYTHIRKSQPEMPVFVFGHSMGSVLARHFTALYPVYIQGLVLSGSFLMPGTTLSILLGLMNMKCLIEGPDKKSRWFNHLFYWNLNRHYRPRPTLFEWISSERSEVDRYVADPYCGFHCSNNFYRQLLRGISATRKAERLITYRKSLPVLVMSGQEDSVGHFGKDAVKIHKAYFDERFQHLSLKIFPGRHELLHEKNKEAVCLYLLDWLEESLEVK